MKYIPDKEINLEKNDLLGTYPYVDTIFKAVDNCDTPFTIGLFGGWGSGKSSIMKTFQEKIEKEKTSSYQILTYDAWKYSHDSFRRTFLLEMKEKLGLQPTKDLENLFYKEEWKDKTFEPKLDKYWKLKFGYFLIVIAMIAVLWVFTYDKPDLAAIISAIIIVNTVLIFFIREAIVIHRTTQIDPKLFAPEQFEQIFKAMIKVLTHQKNNKNRWIEKKSQKQKTEKVIIIIDNLDRCQRETAIELMLSIKNFLEIEGCVFILPVDDYAIKQFIESTTSRKSTETDSGTVNGKEFLRKFFNTTIRIKEFTNMELYDYASKLNENFNLKFSNSVLHLTAREFANNPRRIIQFLNNLISERMWYENAEKKGNIPKSVVLENLEFLAKIQIIREEWPKLFRKISENPKILQEINHNIERDFDEDQIPCLTKEQYGFFKRTKAISTDNEETFFLTRDNLQNLPDRLQRLIDNFDWIGVKEIIKEGISFDRILDYIYERFHKEVIRQELITTTGYSIISLALKIYFDQEYQDKLEKRMTEILVFFQKAYLESLVEIVDYNELISFSKIMYERNHDEIIRTILAVVKRYSEEDLKKERSETIITQLISQFREYEEILEEISVKFRVLVKEKPLSLLNLDNVLEVPENLVCLLDKELADFLILSTSNDFHQNNNKQKVKFLETMLYTGNYKDEILKLITRIGPYANQNNFKVISDWLGAILPFIKAKEPRIYPILFAVINDRHNYLSQFLGKDTFSNDESEAFKAFVDVCKGLYTYHKPNRPQLGVFLNSFYIETLPDTLDTITEFFLNYLKVFPDFDDDLVTRLLGKIESFLENESRTKPFSIIKQMLLNERVEEIIGNKTINIIVNKLFSMFLNSDSILSSFSEMCIKELMYIKHILSFIKNAILEISELDKMQRILKILISIEDRETKQTIIYDIFEGIEETSQIPALLGILINSGKEGQKLSKEILLQILSDLSTDNIQYYRTILTLCTESITSFNQNQKGRITSKIRVLLASNREDQIFALNLLSQIDGLAKNENRRIVEVLEEIQEFEKEEHNQLLDRVIERFRL